MTVAEPETDRVSSCQVEVDGAAPDDEECARIRNRAEPYPGEIFIRHDRKLPGDGDEPDLLDGQSSIRADQEHHGSGNAWEVVRIVSPKTHKIQLRESGPDLRVRFRDRCPGCDLDRVRARSHVPAHARF